MSLLIFYQEEESARIITDTLATTPDGESLLFQSKAWALPHLNMAIAVTGLANLGAAWNDLLCSSAVVQDVRMVNNFAPTELRRIWSELLGESVADPDVHATVYHFGFEGESEQPVRYVYRSRQNFESERFAEPGFGVKPSPTTVALRAPESLNEIIELAIKVREEQDGLPRRERIHIGGELYMLTLRNRLTQTARIYRFEDYDDTWREMIMRVNREEGVA